jgi:adenylate kinase family enzyme
MNLNRTLVIGNCGSGKSWLAAHIAKHLRATWVDLDLIHWLPGGCDVMRDREEAIELAAHASQADRWVIEGIYGWLVEPVQPRATTLVWLCIDEGECAANIRQRGMRRNGSAESFDALLQWAQTYRTRSGSSSYAAHEAIFNGFAGEKKQLRSRAEVTDFANTLFLSPHSDPIEQ